MKFDPVLEIGAVVTNEKIKEIFKCALKGEMRKSAATNTMVIAIDHTQNPGGYGWEDGVLLFSGAVMKNKDKLNSQDKILAESFMNGVGIYMFESFKEKKHIYKGRVKLAGRPYKRAREDEAPDGIQWMFPLKPADMEDEAKDAV